MSANAATKGFRSFWSSIAERKRTLDLSEVAPEARQATAEGCIVYFYEVLTRIELPPLEEVPGDNEIEADPKLDRWTIPHTEITVHRVAEGPRRASFSSLQRLSLA